MRRECRDRAGERLFIRQRPWCGAVGFGDEEVAVDADDFAGAGGDSPDSRVARLDDIGPVKRRNRTARGVGEIELRSVKEQSQRIGGAATLRQGSTQRQEAGGNGPNGEMSRHYNQHPPIYGIADVMMPALVCLGNT